MSPDGVLDEGPSNTPNGGLDESGSVISSLGNRLLKRLNNLSRERFV